MACRPIRLCGFYTIVCMTVIVRGARAAPSDLDWLTIGSPGNPAFHGIPSVEGRGSVAYEYRMTRTEVTVGQWLEFLNAYAPYYSSRQTDIIEMTGHFVQSSAGPGGVLHFTTGPGMENLPADMSWRMAARYANWLHNGKALTRDAFESGVYDTSTFGGTAFDDFTDQATRSPGARYWIPSLDEWIKAVYFDPRLNGGAGGWWHQPGSSDSPLIAGLPAQGGQTSASVFSFDLPPETFWVGSYLSVQTPWGLRDASGGWSEWTEDWAGPSIRMTRGSDFFSLPGIFHFDDGIGATYLGAFPYSPSVGFRLASVIPAPGASWVLVTAFFSLHWRRRVFERA